MAWEQIPFRDEEGIPGKNPGIFCFRSKRNESFLPMKKVTQEGRVGEILEGFFSRSGWTERILEGQVLESWAETVGKEIAEKTQPLRIRYGVLQVRVSNSVWMQQLHFFKGLILQKLNQGLREKNPKAVVVRELKFFLGEVENAESSAPPIHRDHPPTELTSAEKERIEREVAVVKDPELRVALTRIFSKGLETEKSKGSVPKK